MCSGRYTAVTITRNELMAATRRPRVLVALAIAVALLTLPARLATDATPALALAPMPPERTLYTDAPNGMFLLDRGWSTRADPRNQGLRSGWQRPGATAGFAPVAVPNAFNAGDLSRRSFAGRVQWYRVTFTAPEVEGLAQWRLRFESVNVDARIWLNGVALGRHRGAYLPFELEASPTQLHSGENELVVRVDSRGNASDLPPANRPLGWWNYGGVLREGYLPAVRSFDLTDLRVAAGAGNPAVAAIGATLTNMASAPQPAVVTVRIDGPDGFSTTKTVDAGALAAAERKPIATAVEIPNPQLWTPTRPSLYKLTVAVPGGQVTTGHFGVRAWSAGHDGRIRLNGHPLVLRGASFHEETPARGAALAPADRDTLVRELKAIGANFARQHYPPHPALLEAFDREGIVFWEQIPVWRVRGEQLRKARFRRTALAALRAAVL